MSAGLFRVALLAFPRRQREIYAAEMIDAFERELSRRDGLASMRFVLAACLNTIGAGVIERRRHRVRRLGYAFSTLDFTLAWRMLLRYPGLSLVSVFGMAVGIAVAAGASTVVAALMDTRLPLPGGERIVSLLNVDVSTTNNQEFRLLRDFEEWRGLSSIEDLGMSRSTSKNLIADGRVPEPITVTEISASAFRVARVSAVRGRPLLDTDASPDAEPAVVIGHEEWVRRFGADPDIAGRQVRLGEVAYTIVGVMPEGFAFPVNHSFWIPWRLDGAAYQPRTGPTVSIFGRLAPGATLESAQAELTAIGNRTAADWPATHQHLRPRVVPYTDAFTDMSDPENVLSMRAMQLTMVLLLVLVCVNVAILVYARTASRQGEIAVRGALGASRLRIVAQLFVEALTLAGVASAIGVIIVAIAMPQLEAASVAVTGGRLPFWMSFRLSTGSVATIVSLTLLSAAIVGVLPALKATGRDVQARLQTLSPGSGSRMQMGRLWTLLIVGQVGFTVALLPGAMIHTWDALRLRSGDAGFASREFVSVTLTMDGTPPPTPAGAATFASRYGAAHRQVEERLRQQAGVVDVTYAVVEPGQELAMALEAEDRPDPDPVDYNIVEGSKSGYFVRYNRVALNFFDAFGVPVILGRGFTTADAGTERAVISQTAARTVFGDANPLGRRIKYVGRSREAIADSTPLERWHEIVGVVLDFPANEIESAPRVYHPAGYGEVYPARVGVRVRGFDPATFSGPLRDVSATISPNLQVRDLSTPAIAVQREQRMFRMIGVTGGLVIMSVIALSAAGIYALMSFTVARRRREIGIRAALGANRNRLLAGIFGRVIAQLSAGAALGMLGVVALERVLGGELLQQRGAVALPLVVLIMVTVGLVAAWGPARHGLGIQPTEALREE